MLKKTIEFEDLDGNKISEDFYFNVSRTDMIELLIEKPEVEEKLQKLANTMDGRSIVGLLKEFILLGVGKRPEGTRQFVKNEEILNDFRYSGAYDSLLWELANHPETANDFLEGIFPASLLEEIKKSGSLEELRAKVATGKDGETVITLPDKDWAAQPVENHPLVTKVEELPDSGRIDTVEGEVVTDPRTPFPASLPEAVAAQGQTSPAGESEQPAWLKELREPTSKELLEMGKGEMALAFRMREEGKLNRMNKPAV